MQDWNPNNDIGKPTNQLALLSHMMALFRARMQRPFAGGLQGSLGMSCAGPAAWRSCSILRTRCAARCCIYRPEAAQCGTNLCHNALIKICLTIESQSRQSRVGRRGVFLQAERMMDIISTQYDWHT